MKIIFIIQGEGRGHRMQAVALKEILERHGHDLIKVFMGTGFRSVLSRVPDNIFRSATYFLSPFFIKNRNGQGISLWLSFIINIILSPVYLFEVIRMRIMIRKFSPEVIINFYDIIGGISTLFTTKDTRKYCISHHFFLEHPDFTWPQERIPEKLLLLAHSGITSLSSHKKLALSFTQSHNIPEKRLTIIPPLLRKEILNAQPDDQGFNLIYTLYPGYYHEIEEWCKENTDTKVKLFSEFPDLPSCNVRNLEVFDIDEKEFTDALCKCSGVSCTAGFETLAEAAFLGKQLQVVPTGDHFEQFCNAIDLERAGLGLKKDHLLPVHMKKTSTSNAEIVHSFRSWTLQAEDLVLFHLDLK